MRLRTLNLGNTLLLLGCVVLGVTLWVPYATAARVARIERRAEAAARAVCGAATELAPFDLATPDLAASLLERTEGHDLEVDEEASIAGQRLVFGAKHYRIALLPSPEDEAAPDEPPAFEVYAWPRSYLDAGRSVFFFPSRGLPAFSRNLQAGYAGLDPVPAAGCGHPLDHKPAPGQWYRGTDDERWLALPNS